ncbi:MAG: hypothetical protein GXP25_15115 [Planctomycetes bacterium]|nr:hypothetical protein [Planctomycetota bacterium]
MRRLLLILPLLCIAAGDAEWNPQLSEGEFTGDRLSGVGSIMTKATYKDFKFEAKLTFDRATADKASFGFYFGVPPDNGVPRYQVIINEKHGGPSIYVEDYHGPDKTGKTLWRYSLPKGLAKMPKLKLTVMKKGSSVVVGLGRKRALGKFSVDRPGPGHLRLLIVGAPITCEGISVKGK